MIFVIAEVGSNYNGDLELAKRYVRECAEAGVDAVKFQTIRKDKLYRSGGEALELPDAWHYELKRECDSCNVEFMSTPFYLEAVDLLEDVGVKRYKIASGDITYYPLIEKVALTGKPVILSTGASTFEDVAEAVDVIRDNSPVCELITLLHCVSLYPADVTECNLSVLTRLKRICDAVGVSDHTSGRTIGELKGWLPLIMAVAAGATVFEKHVTHDQQGIGPDHSFSLRLDYLAYYVNYARELLAIMGDGNKKPIQREMKIISRIRRDPSDWLRPLKENGNEGLEKDA